MIIYKNDSVRNCGIMSVKCNQNIEDWPTNSFIATLSLEC